MVGVPMLKAERISRSGPKLSDAQTRNFEAIKYTNGDKVVPVSTADYYASAQGPIAPRPHYSALDLAKLQSAGFALRDWEEELGEYLKTIC